MKEYLQQASFSRLFVWIVELRMLGTCSYRYLDNRRFSPRRAVPRYASSLDIHERQQSTIVVQLLTLQARFLQLIYRRQPSSSSGTHCKHLGMIFITQLLTTCQLRIFKDRTSSRRKCWKNRLVLSRNCTSIHQQPLASGLT